jgi:hypothetical protein
MEPSLNEEQKEQILN